ncbi:restriction endonuclease subunit S [Lysobacter sp. HDW10]|uniref:restriction endonuclease subunit S n=1 Tax=Lysobacter sp. HDW10 TaxID=2714936 RepID=UPI001407C3E7|nr:restriction endonuclease subunit S [Lysobacter sp. HDW10]QIK81008.1 restriction endonuclease subunit S [Lysobacter sp. HDW10]
MAKQGAAMVTPRLRFPEFRKADAWAEKPLKEICTVNPQNDGLPDSFIYIDLESVEGGVLKSRNRIKKKSAPSRAQRLLSNGDVIFQVVRPYQRNNLFVDFRDADAYVASSGYAQLRAKGSKPFLYQLIHTDRFVQKVIEKCTGSNYPAINSTDLAEVASFAPAGVKEQQKIADCLTSLDEVIAAQGRMVEALKVHKRSLMQQLLPREGETRPRLRFPEFQRALTWQQTPLGDLVDLLSGYPFDGAAIVEDSSGERLMRGINITEGAIRHSAEIDRYYVGPMNGLEKFRLARNDLVIGMDGSKVGKNSALIGDEDVGALLIQRVARLRAESVALMDFIFQQIHSPRFHAYVDRINTSSGIPHISARQIREYPIHSTGEAEQQRIADCLSSLDVQITAESNQLAVLEAHKRGLMQQLFPATEAVGA